MNMEFLLIVFVLVVSWGDVLSLQQIRPPGFRRFDQPKPPPRPKPTTTDSLETSKCPLSKFHTWLTTVVEMSSETLENKYTDCAKHIKCPFIRRRISDGIDQSAAIMTFILSRHKSLEIIPAPQIPGQKSVHGPKSRGMPIHSVEAFIKEDWKASVNNGKGYYITGKLSTHLYRDDCYFDGPDPDMPVKGLRKYQSAASQLFDRKVSRADILSCSINEEENRITVQWRLEGTFCKPSPFVYIYPCKSMSSQR
jgi:hypothetical protein